MFLSKARVSSLMFVIVLSVASTGCRVRDDSAIKDIASPANTNPQCEIGIIGAGPAGAYAAYRLSVKYGLPGVCLFEKEKQVGGRLRDEQFTDKNGNQVWVGTGGRRVNETQEIVLNMAAELGIELQIPASRSQLINIGQRFGFSPDDFTADFPNIKSEVVDNDPGTSREDEIYYFLMAPQNRSTAKPEETFRAYVDRVAGPDAFLYLRDVSRFRGDFDYDLSAPNYLEYLVEEYKLTGVNHYPVGGMGTFVKKMVEKAVQAGAQVFTNEPLTEFSEVQGQGGGEAFLMHTPSYAITVQKLIITAPPLGFDKVQGTLADQIRARPEYQALVPIRIVVINQQWDTAWWMDGRKDANQVPPWRAWTTENCVQHTEIPQEQYLAAAFVTRSVYSEDPKCVKEWESIRDNGGIEAVAVEVRKGLKQLFGVEVPEPKSTTMQVWPGGWYYTRPGSTVTNAGIAQWSIEPLPGHKNLMMAGEVYWGNRPGWSAGAYLSVNKLLETRFD